MKPTAPRTWPWFIAVCLTVALFFSVTRWLIASPAGEITKAVAADGKNVQQANADEFVNAFSAVIVGVDKKQSSSYVDAAVTMRPDLKDKIVAAAGSIASTPAGDTPENNVSHHQRKCKICCHHHTITLPCNQVAKYLQHHPECCRGACHD